MGKPATTKVNNGRIISHGHAELGATMARDFLNGMRAPGDTVNAVATLVAEHMNHVSVTPTASVVRRMANRLAPHTNVRMLAFLVEADASGRFPAPPANPMADWVTLANTLRIWTSPPRPIIQGRHLIELGMTPGPAFGPLIKAAFNAQLDGVFSDVPSGLAWIAENT